MVTITLTTTLNLTRNSLSLNVVIKTLKNCPNVGCAGKCLFTPSLVPKLLVLSLRTFHCGTTSCCLSLCRYIFRYITVLYYLNQPEAGGETAFPAADVDGFNETVSFSIARFD